MNNHSNNEVSLQHLSNNINGFMNNFLYGIYNLILFALRKWILVLALIIAGSVLGYFIDSGYKDKKFHKVLLVPNFGSTPQLYEMINFLNPTDIEQVPDIRLSKVKIEPVYDAYNFILNDLGHMQAFKFLTERSIDIEKYAKSKMAAKNYKFHSLEVYTDGNGDANSLIDKLLEHLNKDPYFNKRKEIESPNTIEKRDEIQKTISAINGILEAMGTERKANDLSLNSYTEIADVFLVKESLIRQLNAVEVQLAEQNKIFFDASRILNIKDKPIVPMVFAIPVLFLLVFFVISYFFIRIKNLNKQ
ncbi:MAG: hypothetical protein Q4B43_04925 [Bacteroidota bacterium]|nr:hypothetical protein [Bacteroidota bacterium]